MFKIMKRVSVVACALALICFAAFPVLSARTENRAYAAEENGVKLTAPAENETTIDVQAEETNAENAKGDSTGSKAIAAGIAVGLAAALGALAMGIAIGKSNEAIARQPEATSQIRSGMMLGLVFIETAIIYALIVAILIIFVL
mgnify:FL=1